MNAVAFDSRDCRMPCKGGMNVRYRTGLSGKIIFMGNEPTDREVRSAIARRLRRARTALGLSQANLAAGLQVSEPDQSRYETGVHLPGWRYLWGIEKKYGITVSYLVTGSRSGMKPDLRAKVRELDDADKS